MFADGWQQLIHVLNHLNRKIPWRLSKFQKARQRKRLRAVDSVVDTVQSALAKNGFTLSSLETWKAAMPTEQEMLPKDKYTIFDRKEKRYRKGIHSTSRLDCGFAFAEFANMMLQSYRSGRGYRKDSTLLVIRRFVVGLFNLLYNVYLAFIGYAGSNERLQSK